MGLTLDENKQVQARTKAWALLCYLHWTRHLNLEVPFTDHPKGIDSDVPAHSVKQDGSLEKKTWPGAVLSSKNRMLGLRVSQVFITDTQGA